MLSQEQKHNYYKPNPLKKKEKKKRKKKKSGNKKLKKAGDLII